jgi:hypothetical protein
MGETCNTHERDEQLYNNLTGKSEEKRPLGRARSTWEDNIKMDLREIGQIGVNCRSQ